MSIKRTGRPAARPDGTVLSGGAFAATQLDGPTAGLATAGVRTNEEISALISASSKHLRENPEEVEGYDPAHTGHNAIIISGIIKQRYPEAETVIMEERFTSGVNLRVLRVEGPDGVIAQYEDDNELCELIDENGLDSAADSMVPYARGAESYLTKTGRDENALKSEYTMNIERALDFGNDEALASHSARGEAVLASYQSRFEGNELEPEFVASDVMADIAHWAKANGFDFRELADRAEAYAENEEDELT